MKCSLLLVLVSAAAVRAPQKGHDISALRVAVSNSKAFQEKVSQSCSRAASKSACSKSAEDRLFCQLLQRQQVDEQTLQQAGCSSTPSTPSLSFLQVSKAPEDELAKEMTHDLEMNFNKIAPFGKEDTAKELQDHAAK